MRILISTVTAVLAGCLIAGCSSSSRRTTTTTTSASTAATTSSTGSPTTSATPAPLTSQPLDVATTVTVLAGGFSPAGATRQGEYGVDEANTLLRRLATYAGQPVGADDPLAPNQVTEALYYGDTPPAYYSAQDVQDVESSPAGTLRYAKIVAKHAREVLRRSGAAHVNLAGASYGGIITRTVIELDLEGLASSGRIARWLTLEGTQGGVYVASQINLDPALVAGLSAFFDASDATTMTYDFAMTTFGTPTPQRSLSPLFSGIQVGFHVSSNHDMTMQLLRIASNEPSDGLLLVRDQVLELDANPNPAVVVTDTTHDSARSDEGLAMDVVNFIRSSKRVRVRLIDATRKAVDDDAIFGNPELAFESQLFSPEAEREFGITDAISTRTANLGTAPWETFAAGETKVLDATLFDWLVAPAEQTLRLTLGAVEMDFNDYFNVIENPLDDQTSLDSLSVDLDVASEGTRTVSIDTVSFSATVEVQVTADRPDR